MKTLLLKISSGGLLTALLICSNGCMTANTIQEAEGHSERTQWIQFGRPATPTPSHPPTKPHPAYFALLPLTITADVAFSPVQATAWFVNSP
jgi:hypothetical protein